MAQTQYRRSAKPGGFSPIQVGGQSIARMREESQRVAQGMRAARDAEIEDRRRVQSAIKEDQEYTRRALKENQAIEGRNSENKLRQLQLDSQVNSANIETQMQATAQVFKSISDFSETAAEKARELEQKQFDEDYMQELVNYDPSSDATIQQIMGEAELAATSEEQQEIIDEAEANGANPLGVAQARNMSSGAQYARNQSRSNYLLSVVYPQKLQEAYTQNPELMGSSGDTAAFIAEFQREFIEQTGLRAEGYRPEMLRQGLQVMRQTNQSYLSQARKIETNNLYEMQADNATTILTQNAAQFTQNAATSFRTWARNPKVGYSGALDRYESLATARGPNGEFLFTLDQLGTPDLKGSGKSFKEEFPTRYAAIVRARVQDENNYRSTQIQSDNLSYKEDTQRILRGLSEDSSKANAEAAINFFRDTYGKVPPEIQKFAENYTTEAIDKAKQIEAFETIPPGFITQEDVDALTSLDYQAGQRLKQQFAQQESRYNAGIYKETSDSFKSIANGVTSFGSNKPNNPASVFLQARMRAVYRQRVDQAVAGGADFNTAATQIGQELATEVQAGMLDPKSIWYRKTTGPGGSATFPNLNKGNKTDTEKAKDRYNELKQRIADNGVEHTVNQPESIITKTEAEQLVKDYGKPGFTVPTDVLAVAGMTKGADPFVIINKQLQALGMDPLEPPASIQGVDQTVSPEFRELLYKTPSASRSTRALGSSNTFDASRIPNGYGTYIEQSAARYGVQPNLVAALAEIESTFNPDAVSRTGAVGLMQIQQDQHPGYTGGSDPQANIDYGAQFYSQLLKQFGDPVLAAGAYNAGGGRMAEHLETGRPLPAETVQHMKKFAKVMYKYGGGTQALSNPNVMRGSSNKLLASTESYIGMDTSGGPDRGNNACVWALNKVMRAAGMEIPWGESVYVPFVKGVLDKQGRRVNGPVPGAIAIMQDNGSPPYPHIGIVDANGMIVSNSSSRAKFDWRGTPQEYEQKYGRPNLYYMMN